MLIYMYTVFQKKTPTHIVGYKLRNSCLILIIFDTEISEQKRKEASNYMYISMHYVILLVYYVEHLLQQSSP